MTLLRVMTFNICKGGTGREGPILEVIKSVQPDVVFFQELTTPDMIQRFAATLDMALYFTQANTNSHNGLLSRFPIQSAQSIHPFPPVVKTVLEATIEIAPTMRIHMFGVHLMFYLAVMMEWWRRWELDVILKRVAQTPDVPILMAGDFNTLAPGDHPRVETMPPDLRRVYALQGRRFSRSAIQKVLNAGFTDCYRALHTDEGYTLPPPSPNSRLDYIFVNTPFRSALKTCEVIRVSDQASDHYPVMAEFEL